MSKLRYATYNFGSDQWKSIFNLVKQESRISLFLRERGFDGGEYKEKVYDNLRVSCPLCVFTKFVQECRRI